MPRNAWLFTPILFTASALQLPAALPELSSLEPLEFDEESQRLVARGDARLDFDETRLRADRITYYTEFSLADATGNVAISRQGFRLVADRLTYDAEDTVIAIDRLKTGQWPYYVSGATAGGSLDEAVIEGATLYYGDPGIVTPSVAARSIEYFEDERGEAVKLEGATFRVGSFPLFYLPKYTHYLGSAPYYFDANAGYDDELGAYLQTTTLFPLNSWLRAGANLDFYSKRGLLAGPAAQYTFSTESQALYGALSTGYAKDDDVSGFDDIGEPIEEDRIFAEWRHKHAIGERFTATVSASYWSDSEVTRDFRDDYYDDNRIPDNFVEGVYAGDNYFISAFGRFRPNDFQLVEERLPEVRLDILPTPIFKTGAYHKASLSYARLRESYDLNLPVSVIDSEADRADLTYRIERPIGLTEWLSITPLAGARLTQYENQEIDPLLLPLIDDSTNREIFELGFDLQANLYAEYPTINRVWDIDGLRHIVRPVVRYRYFSDPDTAEEIAAIDRTVFNLNRPILDLSDLRNVDQITETHLARLGLENLFQTKAKDYGSRTMAALNFYQDVIFEKSTRYDGEEEDTFNATWIEMVLSPAPWLKFDMVSRFQTEELTLEEIRTRTTIRSGEIWELGLSTDLLNKQIDQYRLDFIYRLNERVSLLTEMRFDADTGETTRSRLGFETRFGSAWAVFYALTYREDALRESDLEFTVRLRLIAP
ncbi:MAG: LPS assembly protein LptD [Verrucomicrobiota bacterium]